MNEDGWADTTGSDEVGEGCLAAFLFIPALLLEGLVLAWLWFWFVVPFGVQQISLAWAMGIELMVLHVVPFSHNSSGKPASNRMLEGILLALAIWGFGYITHCFM